MLIEVSHLSPLKKIDNPGWSNLFTISTGWPFKSLLKSLLFHGGNHKPLPNFPPQVVDSHTTGVAHVRCGGNQITMSGDYWSMTNDYYWLLWSLVKKKDIPITFFTSFIKFRQIPFCFVVNYTDLVNDIIKDKRFENETSPISTKLNQPNITKAWWSNFSKICRDVQDNSSQNWSEGTIFLNSQCLLQAIRPTLLQFIPLFPQKCHSHCILILWESPCYPYFIPVMPLVPSDSW